MTPAIDARNCAFGAIGMALGEPAEIEELRAHGRAAAIDGLLADGLRRFRRSHASRAALGVEAFRSTLDQWPGDPRDIDLILYCTETRVDTQRAGDAFYELCVERGQLHAPIIGVDMGGCGNLGVAFRFARSLIQTDGLSHVAVVTADAGVDHDRIAPMELGILSDGAASCIVSADPLGPAFEILGLACRSNNRLRTLDMTQDRPKCLVSTASGVREAARAALRGAELSVKDVSALIAPTVRLSSLRFFAQACGLGEGDVFHGALADCSHAYAADVLINLASSEAWRAERGANALPFLALSLGPVTWSAMVLRAC